MYSSPIESTYNVYPGHPEAGGARVFLPVAIVAGAVILGAVAYGAHHGRIRDIERATDQAMANSCLKGSVYSGRSSTLHIEDGYWPSVVTVEPDFLRTSILGERPPELVYTFSASANYGVGGLTPKPETVATIARLCALPPNERASANLNDIKP